MRMIYNIICMWSVGNVHCFLFVLHLWQTGKQVSVYFDKSHKTQLYTHENSHTHTQNDQNKLEKNRKRINSWEKTSNGDGNIEIERNWKRNCGTGMLRAIFLHWTFKHLNLLAQTIRFPNWHNNCMEGCVWKRTRMTERRKKVKLPRPQNDVKHLIVASETYVMCAVYTIENNQRLFSHLKEEQQQQPYARFKHKIQYMCCTFPHIFIFVFFSYLRGSVLLFVHPILPSLSSSISAFNHETLDPSNPFEQSPPKSVCNSFTPVFF